MAMRTYYLIGGAVVLATVCFACGAYYGRSTSTQAPIVAAQLQPQGVEGAFVSSNGSSITIKTRDGSTKMFPIDANAAYVRAQPLVPVDLGQMMPGTDVAFTPDAGGVVHEVQVLDAEAASSTQP